MKRIDLRGGGFAGALLVCVVAGCSAPATGAVTTPSPSMAVTPTTTTYDAVKAAAQRVADGFMDRLPRGSVKAAAYVMTTATGYIVTLPDTAGFASLPPGGDAVIVVAIEGWIPAAHSCGFASECFDTGIMVAYDFITGATLDVSYLDDPWSPDRPSPGPSVSDRFRDLGRWGTPILLQVPS